MAASVPLETRRTRSTYCRPSASWRTAPSPRTTNGGVPPTAPNARTGELTPPGITRRARSNSPSDRVTGLSSPTTTSGGGHASPIPSGQRPEQVAGQHPAPRTSDARGAGGGRGCGHGRLVALHRPPVDPVGRVDRPERGGDRRLDRGKALRPLPLHPPEPGPVVPGRVHRSGGDDEPEPADGQGPGCRGARLQDQRGDVRAAQAARSQAGEDPR